MRKLLHQLAIGSVFCGSILIIGCTIQNFAQAQSTCPMLSPAPFGELPSNEPIFDWTYVSGASGYLLKVYEQEDSDPNDPECMKDNIQGTNAQCKLEDDPNHGSGGTGIDRTKVNKVEIWVYNPDPVQCESVYYAPASS